MEGGCAEYHPGSKLWLFYLPEDSSTELPGAHVEGTRLMGVGIVPTLGRARHAHPLLGFMTGLIRKPLVVPTSHEVDKGVRPVGKAPRRSYRPTHAEVHHTHPKEIGRISLTLRAAQARVCMLVVTGGGRRGLFQPDLLVRRDHGLLHSCRPITAEPVLCKFLH